MASEKRSFIVGTAGHVDHGKSELVKLLTNRDPDRLPEEKERSMTIVLGFAPLDLPSKRRCGMIDVPGHERLVKKMLMGAVGFDLVLLVIACDEGPQRQTVEHLDILNLLDIKNGIIVLNKSDLPHDDDKLRADVDKLLENTSFKGAPRVKVSSKRGDGLDELVATIDGMLDKAIPRPTDMPVFMPVDRKFHVKGIGLIVGGTLWQGMLEEGTEIEVFPSRKRFKIKSIESFERQIDKADAGNRYALKFQGLNKEDIDTGNILITPGKYEFVDVFDARLVTLGKIKKYARLKFHYASVEQEVNITRIGDDFVRVHLESPLPLFRGAKFILRNIAPNDTIGGGEVLDTRTFEGPNKSETMSWLHEISDISDEDYLVKVLKRYGVKGFSQPILRSCVNWSDRKFEDFINNHDVVTVIDASIYSTGTINEIGETLRRIITDYFKQNSSHTILSKADLKKIADVDFDDSLLNYLLRKFTKDIFQVDGSNIVNPNRTTEKPQLELDVERMFLRDMFSPPKLKEVKSARVFEGKGRELEAVISKLIAQKTIIGAGDDLFFHQKALAKAYQLIKQLQAEKGEIKLADFRDLAQTTRKYAQPILELLDAFGYTRRKGDIRVLGPRAT
ncbi:MAG TPA: selenocysteine-specific translation elongation factor [Caldisericia bacterium]|nr:selenocysteine-specific translation elongation factor [Caldisericia bacterium]HPF48083.1 selenocysteine-specific translation elongation factor [Caldisericia bacterium]HPI83980.1 selenocysteine-specific translation elongation factor [Caldisericia bacterium]HPQ92536.1 selenocysteine-specific translation elongation factor [Caldisericia bacterium]HRV74366.1 selenocysteine-specific translation elongation factor [Caldisericia bacterium]